MIVETMGHSLEGMDAVGVVWQGGEYALSPDVILEVGTKRRVYEDLSEVVDVVDVGVQGAWVIKCRQSSEIVVF